MIAGWALGACETATAPQAPETAEALRLLSLSDLSYHGAFRLPAATYGASDLNYAEGPIDVRGTSLLIVGHAHQQALAEFAIPSLVASERVEDLEMAAPPLQPFTTVLDRVANPQGLDRIGSLLRHTVAGVEEVWIGAYEYYDAPADNTHTTLVVRDASDLAGARVEGFYALEGGAHAVGWMSVVPEPWHAALGGWLIAGASSGIPIIGRTSVGPSAFLVDPDALAGPPASVPAVPLLDYDLQRPLHEDLSNTSSGNGVWTHLSRAVFGWVVPGTRTYLVVGQSGGHGPSGVCYKCVPEGETEPCGGYCSVDPSDTSAFVWLYDVEDLLRARRGELEPWRIRPYAHGPLALPFDAERVGGASWDAGADLLYLTLLGADRAQGPFSNAPVVAALRVDR